VATVKRVQDALIEGGLDPGAVDGRVGPRTTEAIRQFQRRVGLPVSGELDAETLASLAGGSPSTRPALLRRNPADPFQRHLVPDSAPSPQTQGR
jgi:peptidoglycan hydrolase-like protein with peptidoglycan-binding domain